MPNLHNEHEYIQDFIKARGLYLVHVLYILEAFFERSPRRCQSRGVCKY